MGYTIDQVIDAYNAGKSGRGAATMQSTFDAIGGATGRAGELMNEAFEDNARNMTQKERATGIQIINGLFAYHIQDFKESGRRDLVSLGNAIDRGDSYTTKDFPGLDNDKLNLTKAYGAVRAAAEIEGAYTQIAALRAGVMKYKESDGRTDIFNKSLEALQNGKFKDAKAALEAGYKAHTQPTQQAAQQAAAQRQAAASTPGSRATSAYRAMYEQLKDNSSDLKHIKEKADNYQAAWAKQVSAKDLIQYHKQNTADQTHNASKETILRSASPGVKKGVGGEKMGIYTQDVELLKMKSDGTPVLDKKTGLPVTETKAAYYFVTTEVRVIDGRNVSGNPSVITLPGNVKEKFAEAFLSKEEKGASHADLVADLRAIVKEHAAEINKFANPSKGIGNAKDLLDALGNVSPAPAPAQGKPGAGASRGGGVQGGAGPGGSPGGPGGNAKVAERAVPVATKVTQASNEGYKNFNDAVKAYAKDGGNLQRLYNMAVMSAPSLAANLKPVMDTGVSYKGPNAKAMEEFVTNLATSVGSDDPKVRAEAAEKLRYFADKSEIHISGPSGKFLDATSKEGGGKRIEWTATKYSDQKVQDFMDGLGDNAKVTYWPKSQKTIGDNMRTWHKEPREASMIESMLEAIGTNDTQKLAGLKTGIPLYYDSRNAMNGVVSKVTYDEKKNVESRHARSTSEGKEAGIKVFNESFDKIAKYVGIDNDSEHAFGKGFYFRANHGYDFMQQFSEAIAKKGYLTEAEKAGIRREFNAQNAMEILEYAANPDSIMHTTSDGKPSEIVKQANEHGKEALAKYFGVDPESPRDKARMEYIEHLLVNEKEAKAALTQYFGDDWSKRTWHYWEDVDYQGDIPQENKLVMLDGRMLDMLPTTPNPGHLAKVLGIEDNGQITKENYSAIISMFQDNNAPVTRENIETALRQNGVDLSRVAFIPETKEAVVAGGNGDPKDKSSSSDPKPPAPADPATPTAPKVTSKDEDKKDPAKGNKKLEEGFASPQQVQLLVELGGLLKDGIAEGEAKQVEDRLGIKIDGYVSTAASDQYVKNLNEFLNTGDKKVSMEEAQQLATVIRGGTLAMGSKDIKGDMTQDEARQLLADLQKHTDPSKSIAATGVQDGVPEADKVEKT